MYAAKPAEQGACEDVFYRPHHPYTWGLMRSLPHLTPVGSELKPIPGTPPSLLNPPSGCRFHVRCPYAMDVCRTVEPALEPASGDSRHLAACHLEEHVKQREAMADETAAKARAAQAEADVKAAQASGLRQQAAVHLGEATTSRGQLNEQWDRADTMDPATPTPETPRSQDNRETPGSMTVSK